MTLCLIAGQGRLPALLHETLEAAGDAPLLAELEGFVSEVVSDGPPLRFRVETLGSFLAELRARGVDRVCFAGAIRRPALDPSKVDAATAPLVPRMVQALGQGDDGALRLVLEIFEEGGFTLCAAHDLLPGLLPPGGTVTHAEPDARAIRDAGRGQSVHDALAQADVGQACVVAAGQVLAVEATPGTDWMLRSLARAREGIAPQPAGGDPLGAAVSWLGAQGGTDTLHLPGLPAGGILFKAPKRGQDRRIDLPAIGPETVRGVAAAGLSGIVIETGGVMVLDAPDVIELADRLGLFLWVRDRA